MSAFGAPFGQQSSAFGATSAFGASAPFGSSAPFGASAPFGGSTPFGNSSAPAFGQASGAAPFGLSSSSAFGGASSTPAFGSAAGAPFGAAAGGNASTPAFGSSFAPQSSPFGTPFASAPSSSDLFLNSQPSLFNQQQRPASSNPFGGSAPSGNNAPLWGNASSSSVFGSNPASTSLFGGAGATGGVSQAPFGSNPSSQSRPGTAHVTWQPTVEYDGNPGTQSKYHSITMMADLRDRSIEELRFEDYAAGTTDPSRATPAATNSLFGAAPQSSSSIFASSAPAFGQSSAFAPQSQSAFGAASTGGLFSSFGAPAATPAASSAGLFSGASPFAAQSSSAVFPNAATGFGAASSSGFFQNSSPAFGQSSSAFGAFGAAQPSAQQPPSQPFGQAPAATGLFGSASSAPAFGQPPANSGSAFGAGLFGASASPPNSAPGFGASTPFAQQPSGFGSAPTTGFGAPAFGATPSSSPAFGLGNVTSQPAAFGSALASTGSAFNMASPTGLFGAAAPMPLGAGMTPQIGATVAPTAVGVPGTGNNPSLVDSYNSVMQHNGTTLAPPGANYGTVLYNLQKLRQDLAEHSIRTAEQAKEKKEKEALAVVVMPAPPLVRLSANRTTLHGSTLGTGVRTAGEGRTPMRGVAGRLGAGSGRVSGTPIRASPEILMAVNDDGVVRVDKSENMPFFRPQQFTASKRKPLRGSEVRTTPLRVGSLVTPRNGRNDPVVIEEVKEEAAEEREREGRRGDVDVDRDGNRDRDGSGSGEENQGNASNLVWSSRRPSQWSKSMEATAATQFDASKYLPRDSRRDYFTIPSGNELGVLTMTELQHVQGFTVGRRGYGQVRWHDAMDVRGLQLEECVQISRGEVAVLPEREAGQLNARALVTLEGMRGKARRSKAGVEETMEETDRRYEKKLRRFCEVNGVRFVSYDAKAAEWKFEVDNFV